MPDIEYMRSFLAQAIGWSQVNAMMDWQIEEQFNLYSLLQFYMGDTILDSIDTVTVIVNEVKSKVNAILGNIQSSLYGLNALRLYMTDTIKTAIDNLYYDILDTQDIVYSAEDNIMATISSTTGTWADALITAFSAIADSITTMASSITSSIVEAVGGVIAQFTTLMGSIVVMMENSLLNLGFYITESIASIGLSLTTAINSIMTGIDDIIMPLGEYFDFVVDEMFTWVQSLFEWSEDDVLNGINSFLDLQTRVANTIREYSGV